VSEPYLSWDGARLEPPWQGIERLAIDFTAPGFAAVVTAHLSLPANGLSPESVTVVGGRRITNLQPDITVTNGIDTIELRFLERGDRSDYYVRLLDGGNDPLQPFFCQGRFNFFVDCEAGDCRPRELLPSKAPEPCPPVDLSRKDYVGFVQMLGEWVRVHNPSWTDLAPASQERMLVEILAHQADLLSYYQDRVANEAFLQTASQRYALRQHGVLLGYPIFDGEAAATTLSFQVEQGGFLPAGLAVQAPRLTGERPIVFSVSERTRVDPANNAHDPNQLNVPHLRPAAWPSADEAQIAAGASRLLLWSHNNALEPGARLAFTQGNFWQIVTLTEVRRFEAPGWVADPADPLVPAPQQVTEISWSPPLESALQPWKAETPPLRLHGNIVEARHGAARVWNIPAAASQPDRADIFDRGNSIVVDQLLGDGTTRPLLRALLVPEGPVVFDQGSDGRPTPALEVFIDESPDAWSREEHLLNSRSFDTHYIASADNDGRVWIELGDGIHGQAIAFDRDKGLPVVAIDVHYRVGEVVDGSCAIGILTDFVRPLPAGVAGLGTMAVTNVRPSGGQRPATLDEIRRAIPESLRHGELQRAVAVADYATVAKQVDGVARAAARAIGGVFNTVIVLVDPEGQAQLTEELRQRVWDYIDDRRMAGREHFVMPAEYVPLEISLLLCIEPGFLRHEVRARVLAELRPGTDKRPGYFHPDRFSFDQEVELGDLLAFVQGIPGVRAVKAELFRILGKIGPDVIDRIELGQFEVARLDADENFPEFGKLTVRAVGLDEVDESLFAAAGPIGVGGGL
jgi:hypothetical protein